MKKMISILLCAAMLLGLGCTCAVSAEEVTQEVPRVIVTTNDGNGNELEKPDGYVGAEIRIEDTDGSVLDETGKIKVRGNSTALAPKKPFNIKFDKKQDVLGMGKGKKWVLLANCFDPTLMRNYIAFDAARELGVPFTSEQAYVELWIDGVFKGCYTLMEPVEVGSDRVDIDVKSNGGLNDFLVEFEAQREEEDVTYFVSNGFRFAASEPEEPTEEQCAYIQEKLDRATGALVSKDWDQMCEALDMDSFARYYLLNEFVKNVDTIYSSLYFYYKDGKLFAGPAWDYDLSQGNPDPAAAGAYDRASNPRTLFVANCNFFHYLMTQNKFRDYIRPIYTEHYEYFRSIYADGGLMDQLLDQYGAVFARNFNEAGWDVGYKYTKQMRQPLPTYEENVDFLRDWLHTRHAHMGNLLYAYDVSVSKMAQAVDDPYTLRLNVDVKRDSDVGDFYVEYEATEPFYFKRTITMQEAKHNYTYTTYRQSQFECPLPAWAGSGAVKVRVVMPGRMETLEPVDAFITIPEKEDGAEVMMGDVTCDGSVTVDDVTELQRITASITDPDDTQRLLGDIDDNGVIDITEATRVQYYLSEQFPEPYIRNIGRTFVK